MARAVIIDSLCAPNSGLHRDHSLNPRYLRSREPEAEARWLFRHNHRVDDMNDAVVSRNVCGDDLGTVNHHAGTIGNDLGF